jgi:hypothetical protein
MGFDSTYASIQSTIKHAMIPWKVLERKCVIILKYLNLILYRVRHTFLLLRMLIINLAWQLAKPKNLPNLACSRRVPVPMEVGFVLQDSMTSK